jgi:23S rRNA pseudouridine2605 synthase
MDRTPPSPPRKPAIRRPAGGKPVAEAPARPESERIAKVLARRGVASRRGAEEMIAEGRVTVNGKVVVSPALNVGPRDRITVDDKPLAEAAPTRLWLYHKPVGLVTSEKDEKGRPTVFGALPPELGRVMSVGRLDITSEGLLLLTNDGDLKRRLELPSTGWLRRYRVRVNGTPGDLTFAPLRQGIVIDGETFQPMSVTLDRQQGSNAWLTVGIREGRNREVRRAMEAVGLTVNRLIRVGYGPFKLGDIAPGAVEEVRPRVLRDQLGLDATPGVVATEAEERPGRGPRGPKPGGPAGDRSGPKPVRARAGAEPGPKGARTSGPRSGSKFGPRAGSDDGADGPEARSGRSGRKVGDVQGARKPGAKPGSRSGAKPEGRAGQARSGPELSSGPRPLGKPAGPRAEGKPGGPRPLSKPGPKPAPWGPPRKPR